MIDSTEQTQNQDGASQSLDGDGETAVAEDEQPMESVQMTKADKSSQEVYRSIDELDDDHDYSEEEYNEMVSLYDQTMVDFVEGELVVGKILAINDKEVSVDIGFKSEGVIPLDEFKEPSAIQVGEDIEVFLDDVEDSDGQLVLSKKKADFMRQWEKVVKAYETDETLQGVCMRRIRGGIVVDLYGVDAFLPGSQIDVKPIRDFDALIGKSMDFKIVKVNELRKNIVVSHRVLIEEGMKEQRAQILDNLQKDQILEGTVKNITDFGVFIDLGGVDGLLHINDLSWGRVNHPSEVVSLDAKIKVQILDFNEVKDRISLGYKQLQPHPWENLKDKYKEGDVVKGKVVNIADYGAFVELEKGVEGLIHISEMSWTQHIKHPSKIVSLGEVVDGKILNMDYEGRKISLGLKQLDPDPWEDIEEKYPVDSRQTGVVRNLTNFGAFVELEEGIDGLIHISDLSWTKKIRHPGEVVKKGDQVEVMVLNIDKSNRRISLGLKQIESNPWDTFEEMYGPDKVTKGKIVRMIEKGVIVELPDSVDGFVPMSQLQKQGIRRASDGYKVGDELELSVIEFNKENKKIILSEKQAVDRSGSELAVDDHEAIAEFEKEAGIDSAKSKPKAKSTSATDDETAVAAADADVAEATVELKAESVAEAPATEAEQEAPAEDAEAESSLSEGTAEVAEEVAKAESSLSEGTAEVAAEEAEAESSLSEDAVEAAEEEADVSAAEGEAEAVVAEKSEEAPEADSDESTDDEAAKSEGETEASSSEKKEEK